MSTSWTFGGTNLASAFGKITVIDDYLNIAERRGDNIEIPFHHGTIFTQKYFDERTIVLGIAILGTSASDLETKFDTLKTLIGLRTRQTLSNTREDSSVRTIQAIVNRALDIERISDKIAKVIIEFNANSPFFRASSVIADNTITIDANPKAMTVTNPGNVEETEPIITLTGPLQNTVITNSTNGAILTYTATIASPRVVTISIDSNGQFIATDDLGTNVISNITHSGFPSLFVINSGANTLSIADATHTTGTVKISFYAPYQ